ncbi:MAG: hypothetical protein IPP94_18590 [Ignavibacteria bacterium]|nr:hypothetical protein [Ignavibacteria bacterium]
MFQPAAYAAVRLFTNERRRPWATRCCTLMNLGGFASGLMSPPIRGSGVTGIYWVYATTIAGLRPGRAADLAPA